MAVLLNRTFLGSVSPWERVHGAFAFSQSTPSILLRSSTTLISVCKTFKDGLFLPLSKILLPPGDRYHREVIICPATPEQSPLEASQILLHVRINHVAHIATSGVHTHH
jgi:hypothetical protein